MKIDESAQAQPSNVQSCRGQCRPSQTLRRAIGNHLAEHLERLTTLTLHGEENPKQFQRAPRVRLSDYSRPRHSCCFVDPIKREGPEACLIRLNHDDWTAAEHSSGIVKDRAGP